LNVHTAIPLPDGADADLSSEFPEYVARRIDADLRAWIRAHRKSGGLVVLVGDAAAGKTRCLYEALCAEVPDWRMPRVETGAQANAVVREGVDLSRTVLWLDDLQNFFADDALTAGSVRQLVAGRLGPVLLAGTIRAEELERLLSKPESNDKLEAASQHHAREVIRMLARWSTHSGATERALRFHLDSQLTQEELARAQALAGIDPRLRTALRVADDRNVIATLSGAPELIDRWILDTGDPQGQALITAAVTARRCGHPEPIPTRALEALALAQLAARASAPVTLDWVQDAIEWAGSPVEGNIRALRRAVTSPGVVDGFKVSDILLQYSYEPACQVVRPLLDDESTWTVLLEHATTSARADIGFAAHAEGKTAQAERAWLLATGSGDARAMRGLGWLHADRDQQDEARRWFQQAIDLGDTSAMLDLAYALENFGEPAEMLHWLRAAADRGDPDAMSVLGFELDALGEPDEAEVWYKRAADLGDSNAMANLGHLLGKQGHLTEAENWDRQAATLGHPGAMHNLAELLKDRGQIDETLEWYRKAADRAITVADENPDYFQGNPPTVGSPIQSWASLTCSQRWERFPRPRNGSCASPSWAMLGQLPTWRTSMMNAARCRQPQSGAAKLPAWRTPI
jgi:TPR repeat protein